MAPSIEIDVETFEYLKRNAEPLVDSPTSVLRRLLGIDQIESRKEPVDEEPVRSQRQGSRAKKGRRKQVGPRSSRAPSGSLMPRVEYEMPILTVLGDHGGRAASREVVAEVGEIVGAKLTPKDLERLSSGVIRWENRVHFTRLRLIERGLLKKDSPRGVWEISDKGDALVRES